MMGAIGGTSLTAWWISSRPTSRAHWGVGPGPGSRSGEICGLECCIDQTDTWTQSPDYRHSSACNEFGDCFRGNLEGSGARKEMARRRVEVRPVPHPAIPCHLQRRSGLEHFLFSVRADQGLYDHGGGGRAPPYTRT